MGNNHNDTTYRDNDGDKCGSGWPNASAPSGRGHVNVDGTDRTCDGRKVDNSTKNPVLGSGLNKCNIHSPEGTGGMSYFAGQGKKISGADVTALLTGIRRELDRPTRAGSSGLRSGIGSEVDMGDFNNMADILKRETGVSINFSGGIEASKVNQLISQYNRLTQQCICHSDCGNNQSCSCHNNCGCHY